MLIKKIKKNSRSLAVLSEKRWRIKLRKAEWRESEWKEPNLTKQRVYKGKQTWKKFYKKNI